MGRSGDWDDGTVNHAASPEWNAGVGRNEDSFVEVTLRLDRANLEALTRNKIATVYTWLERNEDGTYALLAESPWGEMAYQSQVNHADGVRFNELPQDVKDRLGEEWAAVRDGWGEACNTAMRELYEASGRGQSDGSWRGL
jgi:hypothetical protein